MACDQSTTDEFTRKASCAPYIPRPRITLRTLSRVAAEESDEKDPP